MGRTERQRSGRCSRLAEFPPRDAIPNLPTRFATIIAWDGPLSRCWAFSGRMLRGYQLRVKLAFVSPAGKSSENTDAVEARFVDLAPQKHTGLSIPFLSEDPQFARTMTIRWWLKPTSNGTLVEVVAGDVLSDALCGSTT